MTRSWILALVLSTTSMARGNPAPTVDSEEGRIEAMVKQSPKTHIKALLDYNLSKLDAVFQRRLQAIEDEEEKKAFRDAQTAWYSFFEADGVVAGWNARGGSYAHPAQMEQKIYQVRLRIYQLSTPFLQGWIDVPRIPQPRIRPPQPANEIQAQIPDIARLQDSIKHERNGKDAARGAAAMEAFLKTWNPLGRSPEELKATLGEPSEVRGDLLMYYFDSGFFGWAFRFVLRDGKMVALEKSPID